MPVYEFRCRACDKVFEITASMASFDPASVKCPDCGKGDVERLWSSVYAITSKKS